MAYTVGERTPFSLQPLKVAATFLLTLPLTYAWGCASFLQAKVWPVTLCQFSLGTI